MTKRNTRRISPPASYSRGRDTPVAPFERLEERVFLSATAPVLTPDMAQIRWGNNEVPVMAGSYIVTFDGYVGSAQANLLAREAATRLGIRASEFKVIGNGGWASFRTDDFVSMDAVRAAVAGLPSVKWIEPDLAHAPARLPNDSAFSNQWSLNNTGQPVPPGTNNNGTSGADIRAAAAWDITTGSRNVVIAVIDTGVDVTHPDLVDNIWVNPGEIPGNNLDDDGNGLPDDINGYDFGEATGRMTDTFGHGTEVAGVIGMVGNNGQGGAGVAWNVSIMALKIANRFGNLSTEAIVGAHNYATTMRQRGINVVASNNSYGGFAPAFYANAPTGFLAERDAIQRFVTAGGIAVTAAGNNSFNNDNPNGTFFPASYNIPGVISVAASDNNDGIANFSNYGAQTVDLAAPGVLVYTTQSGGGFAFATGTSFSSPTVAGAVALLKTFKPNASPAEIRQVLIDSSDQLPAFQGRVVSGGRLNIARALQLIGIEGPAVRSITPGPVTGQLDSSNNIISTINVSFTKNIDPQFLSTVGARLDRSGTDGVFGSGDDINLTIASVTRDATDPKLVRIAIGIPSGQRLPFDNYRLTLTNLAFRDTDGNRLNGNQTAGTDQLYNFRVTPAAGDNEPNDTLAQGTPVIFGVDGRAAFNGATIGNGLAANLDVDLYRVHLDRGGLITAEVTAQRLPFPSSLDSVLRLFNSRGEQLAINDQFFGNDSFIDFFVSTGGDYYVGVSGFGNAAYDPQNGAGRSSQSTGIYNLALTVALVQDDIINIPAPANTLPVRIPVAENQTQGTSTSFITVSDSRAIKDVNVRLNIAHTFDSDLVVSLIHNNPATGQDVEVVMINRRAGATVNFANIVLDDEASIPIASYPAAGVSGYRPDNPLGAYDGQSAAGLWTLRIADQVPLNSGNLLSWSIDFTFENNIFGPFEFNDTLNSAKNLQEISGTGSASRNAFLGDGAFGNKDRDIFKFTADAGTSLTASVASLGTFNSALRLFDQAGNQLLLSNPASLLSSRIENYVFSSGGTFYLAVSEGNNVAYSPTLTGDASERPALTTGAYTLNVTVAAGVSDPAIALAGTRLSMGFSTDATFNGFASDGTRVGAKFVAHASDGTQPNVEFLTAAGSMFFGAVLSSNSFLNNGLLTSTTLPFSLLDRSDAFNNTATGTATFRNLRVERSLSFAQNDAFAAIDIILTNTGSTNLTNVGWMEGFDPNQGNLEGVAATANDLEGRYARASFISNRFQQGLTVAIAAPANDTRASVNFINAGTAVRDPAQIIALPRQDPDGNSSDGSLVLTYSLGSMGAGTSTRLRYFIFFGDSPADTAALYGQVNNGSGSGFLTASVATDSNGILRVTSDQPGTEVLDTGPGPVVTAPRLPFSLYYPEGFSGDNITTTLRLANTGDMSSRIVLIARYETGVRDQVLADFVLAANGRQNLELINPTSFRAGTSLLRRANAPYALELRSEQPVAATFTHNDLNHVGGASSTLGETFSSRVATNWTFGEINKGGGNMDFALLYNTTPDTVVVTLHLFPLAGGAPIDIPVTLAGFRRGGVAFNDRYFDSQGTSRTLPDGTYGLTIESARPLVASVSHYNFLTRGAEGALGSAGTGQTRGVIPEGQFGLNSTDETISVLNAGTQASDVTLTFIYSNGSTDRRLLNVPGRGVRQLALSSLANFTRGQAYSLTYESTFPVSLIAPTSAFGSELISAPADVAYHYWGFGDGFRPAGATTRQSEYLRIFNPALADVTIEVTVNYANGGTESFRRTVGTRRVAEFNIDDLISGTRRNSDQSYGLTVKGPTPIVAYYARADLTTGAAYGTLGTPFGLAGAVL